MTRKVITLIIIFVSGMLLTGFSDHAAAQAFDPSPPASPVKLIFIHHSTGENWLADWDGGLGMALRDNNYFVSDTNYGWGPSSIGDMTDIGNWYTWFAGENRDTYLAALYTESSRFGDYYSRLSVNPGGENEIIMFKSCFPNSYLGGSPTSPPTTGENPLRGMDAWSEYMTVANAKGIYNDLLNYFSTRQDKLFVVITAPPLASDETDAAHAANARAFNNWLVNDWRDGYPHNNVAVFDFFNVLTSNGGSADTNDLGSASGNHHRWYQNQIQHIQGTASNLAAYPTGDSHPSMAGNLKATAEFVPLLNIWYNNWKADGEPVVPPEEEPFYPNKLYYPYTGIDGSWETEVCAISSEETQTISGVFKAYDADGQRVSNWVPVTLGPNARTMRMVHEAFSEPENIHYIVLESDSKKVSGYCKFQLNGIYRGALPAVSDSQIPSGDIPVPHVASNNRWKTRIVLLNTTDQSQSVTIGFNNGETVNRVVAPNAQDDFLIRDLFGSTPRPNLGSARIINGTGLIACSFFLNETVMQFDGILLTDILSTRLCYPHVGKVPIWDTWIVAHNPSDIPAELTITPYDSTGARLPTTNVTLDPLGKYVEAFSKMNLPGDTAWFEIEADRPITGFELFARKNQLGGYHNVGITGASGIFPKIDPVEITGIAFVNTDRDPAAILLTCYDNQGNVVATETLNLAPHEKVLGLAASLFSEDISGGGYITFQADRDVAGFQLNFSSDGHLMDALPTLATLPASQESKADWTYMVYVAGDNNLSDSAMKDINEMEMVGSSDRLNILVQAEFSPVFSPGLDNYNTVRGRILKDFDENAIGGGLTDIGAVDMGNKDALTDFIKWGVETYPAEHYALVLWDHGEGWKSSRSAGGATKSILFDETSGTNMTFRELAVGIQNSSEPLDVIDFDACHMGMYEVAFELRGLANFLVFSEDVEPADGNPYHLIFENLSANPDMTPYQLARDTAEQYLAFYKALGPFTATKSAVDMALAGTLNDNMRAMARMMNENMDIERPLIQTARDAALSFTQRENKDLADFFLRYEALTANVDIRNGIQDVKDTVEAMVIANQVLGPTPDAAIYDAEGLAVFLPGTGQAADQELVAYSMLKINQPANGEGPTWGNFINLLVTGNPDVDPVATAPGNFTVWLEWNSDDDLDLIIEEPNGLFAAPYIGPISDNGFLSEDSDDSGISREYYSAAETVQAGEYKIYVNFFTDGTSQGTIATLYLLDPVNGLNTLTLQGSRHLDLSNTAPVFWIEDPQDVEDVKNDMYSDWWIPKGDNLPLVRE